MRILLDESLPRTLGRLLEGHETQTVQAMGWSGQKNGKLLGLAYDAGFDAFLTADQGIPYQQNLAAARVAVLVLAAQTSRLSDLAPFVPAALEALRTAEPGAVLKIDSRQL